MKQLNGKKALITGAASGIGRAIAIALADAGVHLYLLDIDAENLQAVAEICKSRGVEAVTETCDLLHPGQISIAIQHVLTRWDGVDLLINNAGIGFYGRTERMTADQWNRLLAINLHAPIQIVRELLPSMLARDEAHILNVCSILGLVAGKRMTAYQTSKFALVGFSKALRAEYVRRGLGVTALCPGFVRTSLFQSAEIGPSKLAVPGPPRWMLTTPEKVAARALHAIRRNRSIVTVTPAAWLIWYIDRLIPGIVDFLQRTPWRKRRRKGRGQENGGATNLHESTRIATNRNR